MDRGPNYAALNHRQRAFVDGIMSGKSQTQAAKDAGYSAKSAGRQGVALSQNPNIQAALREVRGPDIATVDEIQRFWTASLRDDFTEVPGGPSMPFKPMTRVVKAVCPACEHKHEVEVGIEPKDRLKASELIAKSRAMLTEKVQHSGSVALEVQPVVDMAGWTPEEIEAYRELAVQLEALESATQEAVRERKRSA